MIVSKKFNDVIPFSQDLFELTEIPSSKLARRPVFLRREPRNRDWAAVEQVPEREGSIRLFDEQTSRVVCLR